jgi:hypothetical protein
MKLTMECLIQVESALFCATCALSDTGILNTRTLISFPVAGIGCKNDMQSASCQGDVLRQPCE